MGTNFNPPGLHPSLSWSDKSPFEHCVVSFSWNHDFHCSNEPPGGSSGRADQVEENPDINRLKRKFVPLDQHELQSSARAPSIPHLISFMPCGPSWTNNSCAYDALTAVLYNIWQENPPFWHESFCSINSQFLAPLSRLMLTQSFSPALADRVRDELRSLMYNFDGSSYQPGQYVSAVDIAVHLFSTGRSVCTGSLFCVNGHAGSESMRRQSYHSAFIQIILDDNPSSIQDWIHELRMRTQQLCVVCQEPLFIAYSFTSPTPLLGFEVPRRMVIDLSITVTTATANTQSSLNYRLAAVIYFGSGHFTIRYVSPSRTTYYHDGLDGHAMQVESVPIAQLDLFTCRGKTAVFVLYAVSDAY